MTKTGGIASERLKQIVARIERLEEDKRAIADDIKEVYAEAKSAGFETKILRHVIKLRKMDKAEFQEQEALLDLYMQAVGMLPLFEAAGEQDEAA